MGKLKEIADAFVRASEPDQPDAPTSPAALLMASGVMDASLIELATDHAIGTAQIIDFVKKQNIFRRLRAKADAVASEIRRLGMEDAKDKPDARHTELGNRVTALLVNPDEPLRECEPAPSRAERVTALYGEQHAIRTAIATAGRALGAVRAKIQRALADSERDRYLAVVTRVHDAIFTLEAALDDEHGFHRGWVDRGFPLWGRLPRACMPALASAAWCWRTQAHQDGILQFSATGLKAIMDARERKAADSANFTNTTLEESSNAGITDGVIPATYSLADPVEAAPQVGLSQHYAH
jgi:hypothetical protein